MRYGQDHEDIYSEGYDAALEGLEAEDNPYDDGTRAGLWDAGFEQALKDEAEAGMDSILAQQELEDFEGMQPEDY